MRTNSIYFLVALLFLTCASANAQEKGDLGDEQINVVKQYQPTLSDAYKISKRPSRDTAEYKFPVLNYEIEPVVFGTNFNITPIKAVRIKDKSIKKLYKGFVKAGYGNYNTPSLDLLYNTTRSKKQRAGIAIHHLSSTPLRSAGKAIKDRGYPGFSDSKISLNGEKYFDETKLGANVSYERNAVYFYGYDTDNALFTKKGTKRTIQTPEIGLNFGSNHNDKDRLKYNAGIGYYNSFDKDDTGESAFLITTDAEKRFDEHHIKAGFNINFVNLNQPTLSTANNTFSAAFGHYMYEKGLIRAVGGLNINYIDEDDSNLRIYPHLDVNFEMIDDALVVYGILSGESRQNLWRNLVRENPWIATDQVIQSSNHKFILEGGIRSKIEKNISLNAGLAYERIKDEYFFVNDSTGINPVTFSVMYDDVDLIRFNAELAYSVNDKFDAAVGLRANSYSMDKLDKPFHKNLMQFTLAGTYNIADKLYVKPLIKYNAKTYALDQNSGESFEIDPWFDANLSVDYRYSRILSFWVQLNNLGFAQYERYFNYPSYRFNGMAGLTYSF